MLARLEKVLRLLPEPVKQAAKRLAGPPDRILIRGFRRRTGYEGPFPPAKLRARVGSGIRPDAFFWAGCSAVGAIEDAVRAQGREFSDFGCIYDWGCGCGRLLIPLPKHCAADARIIGTDVDDEAIAWAAAAWPELEIKVNAFKPPLPVGAGEVDLLISSSIFTHLTEADQDLWLAEVHRVLAPGGLAVISVMGEDMHRSMRDGVYSTRSRELVSRLRDMPDLQDAGFIFEPYEVTASNREDFKGITDVYGVTYHSRDYIEKHWSPWLKLLDHRPSAMNSQQDLLVLAPA